MTRPAPPLEPGARIGIFGGGQLGRMLALAGARLGFDMAVFTPDADAPAARAAAQTRTAAYDDADAVRAFAQDCAALTYEFENIPVLTVETALEIAPVRPGPAALAASQDRLAEKRFVCAQGAATTAFRPVETLAELEAALESLGLPAVLKARRFGYDGKGQARIEDASQAAAALAAVDGPAILEAFAPFKRELSLILARGLDGSIAAYPLSENRHEGGILRETRAPASQAGAQFDAAKEVGAAIAKALDYVGVLAVEFFETEAGLLVNEIAPRVHNTGHWTLDACLCSQFEQHIRAIAGWPLGDPKPHSAARMVNVLGPEVEHWESLIAQPGAALHLYGKREAPPGRKMGHITRLSPLGT